MAAQDPNIMTNVFSFDAILSADTIHNNQNTTGLRIIQSEKKTTIDAINGQSPASLWTESSLRVLFHEGVKKFP